jgi:hypothetical protein
MLYFFFLSSLLSPIPFKNSFKYMLGKRDREERKVDASTLISDDSNTSILSLIERIHATLGVDGS